MNIRRGFNRLFIVLYAVWLVVLLIESFHETNSKRHEHLQTAEALANHERFLADQELRDETLLHFQRLLPERTPEMSEGTRARILEIVNNVLNGRSHPEEDKYFENVVRWKFFDVFLVTHSTLPKFLTPHEVAEHNRWRDRPFLAFVGHVFGSEGKWVGWILAFGIPGGLYLSILVLAFSSRWVYRGFSSPKALAVESNPLPVPAPTSDKTPHPSPVETSPPRVSTMRTRIMWLVVVTVLWILGAAVLGAFFPWARGSRTGAAWWLWLVLALLWRFVIEMVPVPKKQPIQKAGGAAGGAD